MLRWHANLWNRKLMIAVSDIFLLVVSIITMSAVIDCDSPEEKELLTLPEHRSSSPVFSGVRVTRSWVLCVCFVDRCCPFMRISFGHCCLFFFDLWILITPLVSSNYSSNKQKILKIQTSNSETFRTYTFVCIEME